MYIVTHCNDRHPLLDGGVVNLEIPFHLLFPGDRITSSSFTSSHPPSQARMSGNGWCAESMCTVGSGNQYLQVDFGAEVVVEAIAIEGVYNNSLHVTEYYVEYGSDVNQLYCVTSKDSNKTVSKLACIDI